MSAQEHFTRCVHHVHAGDVSAPVDVGQIEVRAARDLLHSRVDDQMQLVAGAQTGNDLGCQRHVAGIFADAFIVCRRGDAGILIAERRNFGLSVCRVHDPGIGINAKRFGRFEGIRCCDLHFHRLCARALSRRNVSEHDVAIFIGVLIDLCGCRSAR